MEGSTLKFTLPPLWPTYISERRATSTFAEADQIKVRCYWELLGNMSGTWGFLCFDPPRLSPLPHLLLPKSLHGKWTVDISLSTPNTTFFLDPLHSMTWLLIGCTEILFLKFGCYYFWPGLIALPKKNPHLLRIRVENWINPSWHIIVT